MFIVSSLKCSRNLASVAIAKFRIVFAFLDFRERLLECSHFRYIMRWHFTEGLTIREYRTFLSAFCLQLLVWSGRSKLEM